MNELVAGHLVLPVLPRSCCLSIQLFCPDSLLFCLRINAFGVSGKTLFAAVINDSVACKMLSGQDKVCITRLSSKVFFSL